MALEELSDERRELVSQFQSITGLESDDETENICRLLGINDWNLNNAISTYFDSKFASVQSQLMSSGFESIEADSNLAHLSHRNMRDRDSMMNLQSQLALDSFLPRLPKAPRISNNWQLDVGIYSSLKGDSSSIGSVDSEPKRTPITSLWLILLIIPKTILQIILSIFKYLFGVSMNKIDSENRFPRAFNFDNYETNVSFLGLLAGDINDKEHSATQDDKAEGVVETIKEKETQKPSIIDNFSIVDCDFNEVHKEAQNNYSWLLVILVNNTIESQEFLQNLLKSEHFHRLFNKSDGMFKETTVYVNNVERNPESFEVGQTYKVKKLPYVMLVGNVSNNPSVLSSMSIVYKSNIPQAFISEGEQTSTIRKVIKNLHKLMDNFNPQLITQRIDKQEIEVSRLLKQQQDDAYIESLEKDRLKRFQKENEIKIKQDLERQVKLRENFLFSLIQNKWFETLNANESPKIKVSIKLPNGKRIIEVILTFINVNQLYLYIELKIFINDLINSSLNECNNEDDVYNYVSELQFFDELLSMEEYLQKFDFKFELIQPFPKKVFASTNDPISSIKELKSGVSLLVEYIQEESDDSDYE